VTPQSQRVALVTGGGSGVGVEIARGLGTTGHAVAIVGRSEERLSGALEALRQDVPAVYSFRGDVVDEDAIAAIVDEVEGSLGPIEVVVHAAGVCAAMGPTWELDAARWRADVETSLFGFVVLVQRVVPRMLERRRGRLIGLSSYAAVRPAPNNSAYAAGKAGLVSLVESLDAELAETGVHAFCVTPGFVWTEMTSTMAATPWFSALADRRDALPPERVAELIARIARGDADALSGRFLHALDDIDDLLAHVHEIDTDGLYAPRLRRLAPPSAP
jgi:NAD(P)-dependent dehydrogenase (short-subunit alcohol dehydrogenase family)